MKYRATVLATTGAFLSTFVFGPMVAVMAIPTSNLPTNVVMAAAPSGNVLQNIPISTTLSDGSTLAGTLDVTQLAYQNGQLLVTGVLDGTVTTLTGTTTVLTQTFTTVATLTGDGNVCDILFLDLGPIFLDLLGLTVDLSQITLDIDAVAGSGNLLGNLLCALVGLLDQGGPLSGITQLLNQINQLLG